MNARYSIHPSDRRDGLLNGRECAIVIRLPQPSQTTSMMPKSPGGVMVMLCILNRGSAASKSSYQSSLSLSVAFRSESMVMSMFLCARMALAFKYVTRFENSLTEQLVQVVGTAYWAPEE